MPRKNPVLLRRAPLSGRINALTNYRRVKLEGAEDDTIQVVGDGKHDVTTAFYAIMLEELMDGNPGGVAALEKAANGEPLDPGDEEEALELHKRLKKIIDAHNARIDSGELAKA